MAAGLTAHRRKRNRIPSPEFVVVSEGSEHFADNLADRLRQSMEDPCRIGGTEVSITVSMGVAVGTAGDDPAEALLRWETLLRLGCHDAQGYHFHRPLTGQDFEAVLAVTQS